MKAGEIITWEYCGQVSRELLGRLLPLSGENIAALDAQNGIYVVTYSGSALGFGLWGNNGPKIVYVGVSKHNSSRHFKSGSTGTSTLRRSLGALLSGRLELLPVPRSRDRNDVDRFNNYAFDGKSEDMLSQWMADNFQVAFLKTEKELMEPLQIAMIDYNVPIFNFQNNPANKYGAEIKLARKKCAEEAAKYDLM